MGVLPFPDFGSNGAVPSSKLSQLVNLARWWMGGTSGGRPQWAGRQTGTAQSIPTTSWTPVQFNTDDQNVGNGHSTITNNTQFVAPQTGWYWVSANVGVNGNATGIRAVLLQVNGNTAARRYKVQVPAASTFDTPLHTGGKVFLATGQYVEVLVFQNSGGALTIANVAGTDADAIATAEWRSD